MGYYLINIYKYGYDLADYIIDNTKKETLEKMVEINPALQDLIDELGLEEVEWLKLNKLPSNVIDFYGIYFFITLI